MHKVSSGYEKRTAVSVFLSYLFQEQEDVKFMLILPTKLFAILKSQEPGIFQQQLPSTRYIST